MPDYSVAPALCRELGVTLSELMDGESAEPGSIRTYDDGQILELMRRTEELEKQKNALYGVLLIVMGIALGAVSRVTGGSNVRDFISGVLLGISVGVMLAGIFCMGKSLSGKK